MRLSLPCKQGKIQVSDDDMLRVRSFGNVFWESPAQDVILFVTQPGALGALNVTLSSRHGAFTAEMVTKANFEKLCTLFPQVPVQAVGKEWWLNPAMLTHVGVYIKEKDLQREMEAAYQHGWMVQGQSSTGGYVSAAGFWLRGTDKTTITFVRTPAWLAAHPR